MKIIHCADLHLDSKMETNLAPAKAKERKRELLNTFERMVAYAEQNGVMAIIIAGDMFDTARVTNFTRTRVLSTIKKYAKIDFLYLSGNHDESNFINLIEDKPVNLKVFGKNWTTFDYPDVKVTGVVMDENNYSTVYDTLTLSADELNIVVMHGQIVQSAAKNKVEVINLSKLKNKNIDYLALGHIHTFTQGTLDQRGAYCYAGCLEGRGFDECGEKGFVLLEIENDVIKSNFISFAERQLIEISFDITGYDDWFTIEEQIVQQVQNYDRKNLLKVTLCGKYKIQLEKHITMLEQKLNQFYFVKVKDDSVLAVTENDVANDVSLRGEFVRQVLASNLSQAEKEQTIIVGLRALNGEDL
ncbi:MAG: metallophosphoesterase [Clostridia bacterium]|nr:metallophosphoesterase [Clostridia bacterium]